MAGIGWLLAVLAIGALVIGRQKLEELKAGGEQALAAAKERAEAAVRKAIADRDQTVNRVRKSIEDQRRYAHEPLAKDLLVIVDDFERALEHLDPEEACGAGVKAIHSSLLSTLSRHGITRLDSVGKPFDPSVHEAVGVQPSEQPENTVLHEWAGAYTLHERVIRAAKVVLAAPPVDEEPVTDEPTEPETQRVLVPAPPTEE